MEIKLRSDSVEIAGYVNAVGRESRVLRDRDGYFTETIQPGAFARALMRGKRNMLLNHDKTRIIGEEGKNLELKEDAIGLYARATVTDPEVIDKARNGELSGWSFGFLPLKQDKNAADGMQHRTIEEMELSEVSIIDKRMRPCYKATSVFTRADDGDGAEQLEYRAMDFDSVETIDESERAEEEGEAPEAPDLSKLIAKMEELNKLRAE